MFTVKHQDLAGVEVIFSALEVAYVPSEGVCAPGLPPYNGAVTFTAPGNPHIEPVNQVIVYVMNEMGKTVAKYDLNQPSNLKATQEDKTK
jgi:hypothetical protein